jgi:hypothetical protein
MLSSFKLIRSTQVMKTNLFPANAVIGARFYESYTEKQAKKGRPVSPHVTIYKFPVVAISSITNRVTGVALTAGKYSVLSYSLVISIKLRFAY